MLVLLFIYDSICVDYSDLQLEIIRFPLFVLILCHTPMSQFNWMLSLSSLLLSCADLQGSFSLTLTIGNDFLPDIKLLLYAVFLYGEVVADMEEFQVEKCFRHKVSRNTRSVIASLICSGLLWFLVIFYPQLTGVNWIHTKPDAHYFWLWNRTRNLLS